MSNKSVFILVMSLALIGIVTASSEYCNPSLGTDTIIESSGTWTNITIYGECPICVQTINGLECTECPGEPTPTPTVTPTYSPTATPTPCVPGYGVWCPANIPVITPTPTPVPPCYGFWCTAPTPTYYPTSTPTSPCSNGVWCER